MAERITLPSGGWVELRDVADVREKHRRPIARALARVSREGWETLEQDRELDVDLKADDPDKVTAALKEKSKLRYSPEDLDALSDSNDLCIVALVKNWSFQDEINIEGVLNRLAPDYEKLRELGTPAVSTLFISFAPSKDLSSPTPPSSESATGWREEASSTIAFPSTSGETTASSASG